jgi:hypothetical protein
VTPVIPPEDAMALSATTEIDPNRPAWVAGSTIAGVAEVLPMRVGSRAAQGLFEAAGLLDAWRSPPQDKVADDELRRLHRALREHLGLPTARAVARDAGTRAADHLLARHIGPGRQR